MSLPASKLSCKSCGALNAETARFCNHCGKVFEAAETAAHPAARKVCPGCNKLNAAKAGFCASCGVKLTVPAAVPTHGRPAGFWIRALALTLDGLVCGLLARLLASRLGLPDQPEKILTTDDVMAALANAGFAIPLQILYDMLLVGTWGATLGKMLCGIKVVRGATGEVPTYGISFTRSLAHVVSLLPLGLGYLWVVFSPTKRAWHDYMCDTRVVYRKPE